MKLCTGENIECKPVTGTDGNQILYFNENNEEITESTTDSEIKKAYVCLDTGCTVINEEVIIIQNTGILMCNALEGCQLEVPTSTKNIINKRMTTNDCINKACQTTNEDETPGYLYQCVYKNGEENSDSSIKCSLIIDVGYYIDDDDLYTCTNENDEVMCTQSLSTDDSENVCNNSNVGKVAYQSNKYVICDGEKTKELTEEGEIYIIKEGFSDTTYGLNNDEYAFIKATQISSIIDKKGKNENFTFNI